MVIPDWTEKPNPPKFEFSRRATDRPEPPMARPLDRLAAVIVDLFVLLLPIFVLLSSPFKRWMTASFLTGSENELLAVIAGMIALALGLIVAYQTLMHYFFRATLGKILFDLRLQTLFGDEKISLWNSFARSIMWLGEWVFLGIPHLAVFSNSRRRALHDRICDTIVIAVEETGVQGPKPWERGLVRAIFGMGILAVALVGGFQTRDAISLMKGERSLASFGGKENLTGCEAVSHAVGDREDVKPHERLETAMTLYAAGLSERSCLEAEIEREIADQVPVSPVTYLAQAFVNSEDAEVSNSYLDQVCGEAASGPECAMSKIVGKWSEQDWEGVNELFEKAPRSPGYVEVWGVRNYMKQARYSKAIGFMDILVRRPELAQFVMIERVKALWNSYLEAEAMAAFAQALPALPKEESEELSTWLCAEQLQAQDGCDALSQLACGSLDLAGDASDIDYERPVEAMTRVLALECRTEKSFDYLSVSDTVESPDWKNFFLANFKSSKQNSAASAEFYTKVIESASAPEILRVEALRRFSESAGAGETEQLLGVWRTLDSKESWVKAGNFMFSDLMKKNRGEIALKVARHLMNLESLSPEAIAYLTDMEKVAAEESRRQPASAKKAGEN